MIKWKIVVEQEYPLDDGGMDVFDADFDGVLYDTIGAALDAKHKAQDDPRWAGDSFYLKEVEV